MPGPGLALIPLIVAVLRLGRRSSARRPGRGDGAGAASDSESGSLSGPGSGCSLNVRVRVRRRGSRGPGPAGRARPRQPPSPVGAPGRATGPRVTWQGLAPGTARGGPRPAPPSLA